ncbi:hypothetical protein BsWGS_19383 [Bradybaena similaris]
MGFFVRLFRTGQCIPQQCTPAVYSSSSVIPPAVYSSAARSSIPPQCSISVTRVSVSPPFYPLQVHLSTFFNDDPGDERPSEPCILLSSCLVRSDAANNGYVADLPVPVWIVCRHMMMLALIRCFSWTPVFYV